MRPERAKCPQKGEKPMERILLWPEGNAPYAAECAAQSEPSLAGYPVPGSRGAVIICPGGGYHWKAPHEGEPIALRLNEAGISAYVLDYRVNPCPHDAPLNDALRAVRVLRAMGYEKVGILGFSAGGNLACSAATLYTPGCEAAEDPVERLTSRPDALISCYSVVSMVNYPHVGSRQMLLGDQAHDHALARRYSAELNVTADTPPAFIWHTAEDETVPVENSLNLAAAYSRCSVPYVLHIFPKGRHGFGLAEEIPDTAKWSDLCCAWLRGQGFAE